MITKIIVPRWFESLNDSVYEDIPYDCFYRTVSLEELYDFLTLEIQEEVIYAFKN